MMMCSGWPIQCVVFLSRMIGINDRGWILLILSNWRMLHHVPNVSPCAAAASADDELCQFQLRVRLNERDAHELERKRERESEMSEMEEDGKDFSVRGDVSYQSFL